MKVVVTILFTVLLVSSALAETPSGREPELPNALLEAAKRGEESVTVKEAPAKAEAPPTKSTEGERKPRAGEDLDGVLLSLVDEVEALKAKVVVTKHTTRSTQTPKERKNVGSKTVYNYQEGSIYEIHAGVDRVTDIELGPGEYLTNPPVSGDTVRWKVTVLESDRGSKRGSHVIIKPIEEGIETNLILTTNRNIYHLRLRASDWYMPAVSWNYPEDEARALEAMNQRRKSEERVGVTPEKLNFNYDIDGRYDWRPRQVFDDGEKTYIKMPANLGSGEAPALFLLEPDDTPVLVNYRKKGDYYIVDRIFPRAEMRVGKREKVEIRSERDDRNFFERNF